MTPLFQFIYSSDIAKREQRSDFFFFSFLLKSTVTSPGVRRMSRGGQKPLNPPPAAFLQLTAAA